MESSDGAAEKGGGIEADFDDGVRVRCLALGGIVKNPKRGYCRAVDVD